MAAGAAGTHITTQSIAPEAPRTSEARIVPSGRLAGLDGLRALAVILVVAYHFAPGLVPGGYVGVDVFFVLSGFLITTILLREHAAAGALNLRRFWLHRARRLLPALGAVVAVCVAAVSLAVAALQVRGESVGGSLWGDLLVGVGAQVGAAVTFTSNWYAVLAGQSYAAAGSPLLLANLWSLAVEEQFYLLWPLVVGTLITAGVTMTRAARGALMAAGVSAVAMALLLPPDGDPTRVYVGTDTHAFGLMIGAALAFWWSRRDHAPAGGVAAVARRPAFALAAGGAGLAVLAALGVAMHWDSPWTYRGGLVLASLASAIVIAAVLDVPAAGRALDVAPLRWIGERSYGIYLWHWPVLVILATSFDGGRLRLASGATVAIATAITLGAAAASYRWLEMPVRRLGFRQALQGLVDWLYPVTDTRAVARVARRRRATLFGGSVAAVIALAGSAVAAAPDKTSLEIQLDEGARVVADASPAVDATAPTPVVTARAAAPAGEAPTAPVPTVIAMPAGSAVMMIGDSVALGSAAALGTAIPGIRVEAGVGRQFAEGVDRLDWLAGRDRLRSYVVVALGTNGSVLDEDVDRLMAAVGERPVVLVTPYGDRSWIPGAQRVIREAAARYETVVIADWQAAVERDPSVLGPDGIHPHPGGVEVFVDVVEQGLLDAAARDAAR